MGRNRVYTREFRLEAAGLVVDQNYSLKEASNAMGVSKSGLSGWVKQLIDERGGNTPNSKALTLEQQKIQDLQSRIKKLEMEKDILKKATALLMSDSTSFLK